MKRFLQQSALFALILMALLGLAGFVLPFKVIGDTEYSLGILDKIERMKTTAQDDAPRLILLGGSNLAAGIDSELLERETGLITINMGMNAGQGGGYILHTAEPYLRDGDLVLLVLEYGHFAGNWNGTHERLLYMIDVHREPVTRMMIPGFLGWPSGFLPYLEWKFGRLFNPADSWKSLGQRSWFNQYGDITMHLDLEPREYPSLAYADETQIDEVSMTAFEGFLARNKVKHPGIRFLMSYPPFDEASFDAQERLIDALHRRYLDMEHLEVISRPADYRIARGYLYDSPVHPGRAGREIRTRQVMADLEKWRANSL